MEHIHPNAWTALASPEPATQAVFIPHELIVSSSKRVCNIHRIPTSLILNENMSILHNHRLEREEEFIKILYRSSSRGEMSIELYVQTEIICFERICLIIHRVEPYIHTVIVDITHRIVTSVLQRTLFLTWGILIPGCFNFLSTVRDRIPHRNQNPKQSHKRTCH